MSGTDTSESSTTSTGSYEDMMETTYCHGVFYNSSGKLTVIELFLCEDTNMWVVDDVMHPDEVYAIDDVHFQPQTSHPMDISYALSLLENRSSRRITPLQLQSLIYECTAPKMWIIYDTDNKKTIHYMHLEDMGHIQIRESFNEYPW